jgi:hypothetical protein
MDTGNGLVWAIENRDQAKPPPARFVYGAVPPGFVVLKAALPLETGCYEVAVEAVGILVDVEEDGTVRERAPGR